MTKEQKIIRAKVGLLERSQAARQCLRCGLQNDGLPSRDKFLSLQGVLRRRRRIGAARRADAAQTDLEEPQRRPTSRRSSSSFRWTGRLMAKLRIANELRKLGHSISPAGVRGVWQRHELETRKKRLKALEAKVAQGRPGAERKPARRVGEGQERKGGAWRVRERMSGLLRRPGYVLRRQHMKGSGAASTSRPSSTPTPRSPTPSSMIARRPSPRLISSTTASCQFYDAREVRLCCVLTDRGNGILRNPEHHEYELYLALEDHRPFLRAPTPRARKRNRHRRAVPQDGAR